ncbi:MAG: hemolysin family protein [Chloroflexi bacterium]|nr:hemolysin family protein [Chloroflexota bacterium]
MFGDIETTSVVLLIIFVLLSAFFSGAEAALLSVQRTRIQNMVRNGTAGAGRVARLVEKPHRLLPPILLGNNLVNTAAAALATTTAIALLEDESQAVLVATGVVTVILLIFGETIPKTAAARHAERFAITVALPIVVISWVLRPISYFLEGISSVATRLMGSGPSTGARVTLEEIKGMITVGHEEGAVEFGEAEMIRRVLEFGDRSVREVMTPRPEIIWMEQGTTIQSFLKLYNENYHTRFPVFHNDIDNVTGVIAAKDVMRLLAAGSDFSASATKYVRPAMFVPETKRIQELFDEMRATGQQMAMIADEFGGVAGLITLKRLVEDIVGRVGGEDEAEPVEVAQLDDTTFELDAAMSIAEVNDRVDLALPVGEYETLAGFLLEQFGRVPEIGDEVAHGENRFTVSEMRGMRISKVRIEWLPHEE